jgi:Zn-dependent protease
VVWATAILTGLLFFARLIAHELSHALVARLRGIPIHKITLFLLGGVAQIEKEASDAKTEFWMAIVGPFTGGVLGLVLLCLAWVAGWAPRTQPGEHGVALLLWLGFINLGLAAFNMIPGFPLDGGRVLHAILWGSMHDADRSTRAAARVGQVVAVLFIGFGVIEFFQGAGVGGLWLAFIGWFLLQAASASYIQVRSRALQWLVSERRNVHRLQEGKP